MDKTAEHKEGNVNLLAGVGTSLGRFPGQVASLVHAVWYVSSLVLSSALLAQDRLSRGRDEAGKTSGVVVRRGRGNQRRMVTLRVEALAPVLTRAIRSTARGPERAHHLLGRMRPLVADSHRAVFVLPSAADPRVVCLTLTLQPDGDGTQISIRTYRWKADDGLGALHSVIRRLVRELRDAAVASEPQENRRTLAAG